MKYLMNISLNSVLLIFAYCLNVIYGNGLVGFAVLMAFAFISIIVVLAANHSD
jgi:hypothetical protein